MKQSQASNTVLIKIHTYATFEVTWNCEQPRKIHTKIRLPVALIQQNQAKITHMTSELRCDRIFSKTCMLTEYSK